MSERGRPLPKFGEWDVNDPASAEGFTVIFNKARDEKKTGGKPDSPSKMETNTKHGVESVKPQAKKWLCCIQSSQVQNPDAVDARTISMVLVNPTIIKKNIHFNSIVFSLENENDT